MDRDECQDRGSVTVEAAMALPALVAFTVALVWALAAAAAQIQCVDAARAGARAVARSEPVAVAETAARAAAPEGATVAVARSGELWRVTVRAPAPGPGGMGLTLHAEAAALAEDTLQDAFPDTTGDTTGRTARPMAPGRDTPVRGAS
ncbi:TadE family type IV pilus minor pilin [Streptomyces sp. NPDC053755]|uniref:TadE family type IV pilus minor pilin n=1 Tax=Streptomyces sp. NPDC053755 TaxID=3155815 RepID=UPI003421E3DC